jgi:hypothetical protein
VSARPTVLTVGSSSGLIIAFVVVVWAAYFIPLALRRYDEASKNASVETTGALSRVISRPRAAAATAVAETISPVTDPVADAPQKPARSLDRPAARLAAKRRRRTLSTLLLITVAVGAVAGFGVIALYWIAAPVALVVAWLVACRIQVRAERGIARTRTARPEPAGRQASRGTLARLTSTRRKVSLPKIAKLPKLQRAASPAAEEEDTVIVSGQFEDIDPGRKHEMEDVPLEVDALDDKIVIAVPSISTAGEALWDPLPVTLPTYVTKPRAGRTVRTIDFSQPHTWTSGHIEGEDVELPARRDDSGDERRAVGH